MTVEEFFFECLKLYLAVRGNELSQEVWDACHKYLHRYEMKKSLEEMRYEI